MDFVGDGGHEGFQEVCRSFSCGFLMQLGEGELRCPVDGHEEVELAFLGPDFGNVDVKVANRVFFESLLGWLISLHFGQPADAMALVAAMKRRARQMRDGRLKRIEAIVERQQRMLAEGNHDGLLLDGQHR